jgi:hypothetical protein
MLKKKKIINLHTFARFNCIPQGKEEWIDYKKPASVEKSYLFFCFLIIPKQIQNHVFFQEVRALLDHQAFPKYAM